VAESTGTIAPTSTDTSTATTDPGTARTTGLPDTTPPPRIARATGRGACVRQCSAGRVWYSNTRPPTEISRMTPAMVMAQKYMNASERPTRATDNARPTGQ
jgi:hypothetical protein